MIFISFHIFFLTKLAPGFFYFILNINENHMNIEDSMFYIFSNFIEKKKKLFHCAVKINTNIFCFL